VGIGDWGLGIGDWAIPNPQSPITRKLKYLISFRQYYILNNKNNN